MMPHSTAWRCRQRIGSNAGGLIGLAGDARGDAAGSAERVVGGLMDPAGRLLPQVAVAAGAGGVLMCAAGRGVDVPPRRAEPSTRDLFSYRSPPRRDPTQPGHF
jgi:hypothetical protein